MDPYRGELVRVEPHSLVAEPEPEPSPRGVRVRARSDGTARVRIRSNKRLQQLGAWILAALFVVSAPLARTVCGENSNVLSGASLIAALVFAERGLRAARGVRVEVTPAALQLRVGFARARVFALADVSTVLVRNSGDEAHLELQVGRERVPFCGELGYDEATLRWIALRLRRAIEAAR